MSTEGLFTLTLPSPYETVSQLLKIVLSSRTDVRDLRKISPFGRNKDFSLRSK